VSLKKEDKVFSIKDNIEAVRKILPSYIDIEAACKNRSPEEIQQAQDAGIKIMGHNYVKEAEAVYDKISGPVNWHLIGHLQSNKVKKAVKIFDTIETLDSLELARRIDIECGKIGKKMKCLIEINSGREKNKSGVFPEKAESLIKELSIFNNIEIIGLMTMGPAYENPNDLRPHFRETRALFEKLKAYESGSCRMDCLSMGMSDSYIIAAEEKATLVRIGTAIFGPKKNSIQKTA